MSRSPSEIVSTIQAIISGGGLFDNAYCHMLAKDYYAFCRQLNVKIERCLRFIENGQVIEAVSLAEDGATLFAEIGIAKFEDRPYWDQLCSENDWPVAEYINDDKVHVIK